MTGCSNLCRTVPTIFESFAFFSTHLLVGPNFGPKEAQTQMSGKRPRPCRPAFRRDLRAGQYREADTYLARHGSEVLPSPMPLCTRARARGTTAISRANAMGCLHPLHVTNAKRSGFLLWRARAQSRQGRKGSALSLKRPLVGSLWPLTLRVPLPEI